VPKTGLGFVRDAREAYDRLTLYSRRDSGKSIRRRIERRFDSIIDGIARDDPEKVRQMPYARWLLDNSHLVRQALQQIEIDFPSAYHRQLPTVLAVRGRKVPRVFVLVDEAIDQSGLPIDCRAIKQFFSIYPTATNRATRLTLGELWAIPIALRITLLTRLCETAELHQKNAKQSLEYAENDDDVTVLVGCITSLRTVATFNWRDFVEQTSTVERYLGQDPSGFYRRMDFDTRDRYRATVEKIARRSNLEQWEVAQAAIHLASQAKSNQDRSHRQHIGYYLIDKGRWQLEDAVNYRSSLTEQVKRRLHGHVAGLYLSAIVGLAAWGSIALMVGLLADNAGPIVSVAAGMIAMIPLLSVSSGAVNFLASVMVPPWPLPKLDFTAGILNDRPTHDCVLPF